MGGDGCGGGGDARARRRRRGIGRGRRWTACDHYVKLIIPPPGASYRAPFDQDEVKATLPREEWPRTRTYTVQEWDPGRLRLTIDFVHHGSS